MGRVYTAEEKAGGLARLAAEGGNVKRAARSSGVPRKTLEYWGRGKGVTPEVLEMVEEGKKRLAATLMREAGEMAAELPAKRAGANYQQALVGIGIAVDKAQLLSGEPTQITERARQAAREALDTLLQLAREKDPTVTEEQAKQALIELRPELRPVLLPAA